VYILFLIWGHKEKSHGALLIWGHKQKSNEAKSQDLGGIAGQGIPIFPLIKMLATSSTSHSYSVELLHPVGTHLPAVHDHAVPQKMPKIRY
jgi:hypothetical protein